MVLVHWQKMNEPLENLVRHDDVRNGEGKAESEAGDDEDVHDERWPFEGSSATR